MDFQFLQCKVANIHKGLCQQLPFNLSPCRHVQCGKVTIFASSNNATHLNSFRTVWKFAPNGMRKLPNIGFAITTNIGHNQIFQVVTQLLIWWKFKKEHVFSFEIKMRVQAFGAAWSWLLQQTPFLICTSSLLSGWLCQYVGFSSDSLSIRLNRALPLFAHCIVFDYAHFLQ